MNQRSREQFAALLKEGIDPDKFKRIAFSGAHDATALQVAGSKSGCRALNISVWEKLGQEGKIKPDQAVVFHTTPPYYDYILLVPVKVDGALSTLELIDEAGASRQIADGGKSGGHWATEPQPESADQGTGTTFVIGEGVATVLSVSEITGHIEVAALSAGNLGHVARALRDRTRRTTPRRSSTALWDSLQAAPSRPS